MGKRRGGLDSMSMAQAFAHPGIDPRQWVSYGTVSPQQEVDGEVIDSVEFDDELGPLVNVRLQPTNLEVRCRIASFVAGAGEGEYVPFVENDEVIVLIPQGDEASSPCIVGRLNNSIDNWPSESIAGQDPTNNTFAFRRIRTPFIQEYASSLMIRSAVHGGFILMSDNGTITIRDGSKGALQMGPDIFGYMEGVPGEVDPQDTPSPQAVFQYDLTGRRITMQMDTALIQVNSDDADANPGQVVIASQAGAFFNPGTNQGKEHFTTVEGMTNLLEKLIIAIGALLVPPLPPAAAVALLTAALTAAVSSPISDSALIAALPAIIQALEIAVKPPVAGGVQVAPSLGSGLITTAG